MIKEVIERIKARRKIELLTMNDMAARLNVSESTYQRIEMGKTELTVDRLYEIAEVLKMNVLDLIAPTDIKGNVLNEEQAKYMTEVKHKVIIQLRLTTKELSDLGLQRFAVETVDL